MKMKYTCLEMQELLSLYLDDMLEGDEVVNVKDHLSTCINCNSKYLELVKIKKLLGEAPEIHVPHIFDRRFAKAMKKEKLRKNRIRFKKIVSVAAIIMVGFASYMTWDNIDIFHGGNEQDSQQSVPKEDSMESSKAKKVVKAVSPSAVSTEAAAKAELEKEAKRIEAEIKLEEEKAKSEAKKAEEEKAKAEAKKTEKKKAEDEKAKIESQKAAEVKNAADAKLRAQKAAAAATAKAKAEAAAEAAAAAAAEAAASAPRQASYDSTTAGGGDDVTQYWEKIHQQFYNENYKINNYYQKESGDWEFKIDIYNQNDNTIVDKQVTVNGQGGNIQIWE